MNHICEFCNKEFKTSSNLNYHKKTVKYCLDIQNRNNIEIEEKKYECNLCKKQFNRNSHLETHFFKCKEKTQIKLDKEENIKLKKLLDEYKQELYSKDLLLEKTKTELKICKDKIDFYYIDLKYKDKMIRKYKNFLECYKDEIKQLKGENPFE
jgi:uncharacterized Zn-finger protein